MKRILHPNDDGGIAVIIPYLPCGLSLEDIALKDVPAGRPFLIVDTDTVPSDRSQRQAWEADFSAPAGHGADFGVGSPWAVIGKRDDGFVVRHEDSGEVKTV